MNILDQDLILYMCEWIPFKNTLSLRSTCKALTFVIRGKECKPYECSIPFLFRLKESLKFDLHISSSYNLYEINEVKNLTVSYYKDYDDDIECLDVEKLTILNAPYCSIYNDSLIHLVLIGINLINGIKSDSLLTLHIEKSTFDFSDFYLPSLKEIKIKHSNTTIESYNFMDEIDCFWSINTIYGGTLLDKYKKN